MNRLSRFLVPAGLIAGIALAVAWMIHGPSAPVFRNTSQQGDSPHFRVNPSLSNNFEGEASAAPDPLEDFRARAIKDPPAAALWLADQSSLAQDPAWLEQLAVAWTEADPASSLDWARGQPAELQAPLLLAIAGQLVSGSPQEALEIALPVSPSPLRDDILTRALADWASADAAASERWLLSLADTALQEKLRPVLILQLATRDPAAAVNLARENLSAGRSREDTLASVFLRWTGEDPTAALAGASALENPAERGQAIAIVCTRLGQEDPSAAIRTLVGQGVADSYPDVLQQIAARWLAVGEKGAGEWIELQPEGEIRDLLIKQMAITRSQSDPAEAARLIAGRIPPGPVHDEAALSILRHWAIRDSRAASRWVATFPAGAFHDHAARELEEITSRE